MRTLTQCLVAIDQQSIKGMNNSASDLDSS